MSLPVSLAAVLNALDAAGDEVTHYINSKTGEVAAVFDEERDLAEDEAQGGDHALPDWQVEAIEDVRRILGCDDFIELPDRYDIHEWDIMRRFCDSLEDERVRHALLDAIHRRKAFRSFRDRAFREGVIEDWYSFRDQAIRQIAIDFLMAQGIPFDPNKPAVEGDAEGA